MELSSFQLDLMTSSPKVAALLNLTPNHLDRHGTFENYATAKANLLRFQGATDVAILGWDSPGSKAFEQAVSGELLAFSQYDMVPDGAFMLGSRLLVAGSASFDMSPHVVCEREDIPLRGDHNVLNVLAACAITGSMGLAIDRPGVMPENHGRYHSRISACRAPPRKGARYRGRDLGPMTVSPPRPNACSRRLTATRNHWFC